MPWLWMFYELIFPVNYTFTERSFILLNLKSSTAWYSNELGGTEACAHVHTGYDTDWVMQSFCDIVQFKMYLIIK